MIGYGNPARGDDGLGPALAARLEQLQLPEVTVEADYQLSLEHAALIAGYAVVVFADAARDATGPFYFAPLEAAPTRPGSSHAASPAQIAALARDCFGATPRCYVLGIRAHALDDFREGLTPEGAAGLEAALAFLVRFLDGPLDSPELETTDARRQARHSLHR